MAPFDVINASCLRACRRLALLAGFVGIAAPMFAHAAIQEAGAQLQDRQVLVLPVVNVTGEKWAEFKARMIDETGKVLRERLTARRFALVDELEANRLCSNAQVDLEDEETWRKDTFFELARQSGSRYVVFVAITQATQRTRINLFSTVPEGEVTLKCWVLDAKESKPLLSAKSVNAKARPKGNVFGEAKGTEAQIEAARRAVEAALKEALGAPPP